MKINKNVYKTILIIMLSFTIGYFISPSTVEYNVDCNIALSFNDIYLHNETSLEKNYTYILDDISVIFLFTSNNYYETIKNDEITPYTLMNNLTSDLQYISLFLSVNYTNNVYLRTPLRLFCVDLDINYDTYNTMHSHNYKTCEKLVDCQVEFLYNMKYNIVIEGFKYNTVSELIENMYLKINNIDYNITLFEL